MSRSTVFHSILLTLCISSGTLIAQVPSSPDSALLEILSGLKGTPLRLEEAVDRGLEKATSVRRSEATFLAAAGAVRRESGLFDPQLFFNLTYQDQEQPTASFFSGAPVLATQQTTSRSGVRMVLPIGSELEFALNTVRSTTNSRFAFLNPEYGAFGSLRLRQPLLGGFATSARKQLSKSERTLDAEKARYEHQRISVTAEVERAYWDLYAAVRDFAVQQLTRDRAQSFLRETEVRARAGLVGPNQVASARTFLAEQELFVLERQEALGRESDRLASLIGTRPVSETGRFIPVDDPPGEFVLQPVDELVQFALKNNLELIAAQQDVEASRALADAAGWEALPSVNLVGSFGGNGLSGAGREVIFGDDTLRTTRSGSFGDAVSQVSRREFPNWNLGVEVSIPIGFRGGLGEKDRLEAEVLGSQQRYIEKSRSVEEQVRNAYREVANGKDRLKAATEGVEAAQEQVRIGLIEFQNGRTTAFELVRLGADFAIAQRRYSEALVRTAKAAATLKQLTSGGYPSMKKQ